MFKVGLLLDTRLIPQERIRGATTDALRVDKNFAHMNFQQNILYSIY